MTDIARTARAIVLAGAMTFGIAIGAQAAVVGFVNNPTGNAADWASHVAGTSGVVTTTINFEAHPVGPLIGGFYAGQGVTMSITAPIFEGVVDVTGVPSGSGDCPCSIGEGAFPLNRVSPFNLLHPIGKTRLPP